MRQEQCRQKGEGWGLLSDRDARNKGSEAGKTHQKPRPLEQQAWAGEKRRGEEVRASHPTEFLDPAA